MPEKETDKMTPRTRLEKGIQNIKTHFYRFKDMDAADKRRVIYDFILNNAMCDNLFSALTLHS